MVCLYAPDRNPARDLFLDDIRPRVDPSVPTLLCGDFNAVFDRALDRQGSDPSVPGELSLSPGLVRCLLGLRHFPLPTPIDSRPYLDKMKWVCGFSYRSRGHPFSLGAFCHVVFCTPLPVLRPLWGPHLTLHSGLHPSWPWFMEVQLGHPERSRLSQASFRL